MVKGPEQEVLGERDPRSPGGRGPASIVVERRIEWSDTDASGHYHNTAAWRLFEAAETLMMGRLGILQELYGRLPRVHVEADFKKTLRFPDLVQVEVAVRGVGSTSITYDCRIRRGDDLCVAGVVVAVLVEQPGGGASSWPERIRKILTTAGPQAPERLRNG